MTKNNEIKKIWTLILKGDHKAWSKLINIYSDLIFSVARRVGLSQLDAEDCVQQIWLTLYKKRNSIKDPVALPAWLIQSTHRHAIYLAKRLSIKIPEEILEINKKDDVLPDQYILRLEQESIVRLAMNQIDPRCQKIIIEMFLSPQKKSYKQIAKSLNIKPNALGPLRSRCLKKLEKILKKLGYDLD